MKWVMNLDELSLLETCGSKVSSCEPDTWIPFTAFNLRSPSDDFDEEGYYSIIGITGASQENKGDRWMKTYHIKQNPGT